MGNPDELLKQATIKKNSGDLDGAIKLLRAAYKELDKSSMLYSIQTYLRLPLYLQEAGRKDEAWGEFNRLILWVNSKPRYSVEVTPMEQSIIWDKMRLFLQREGKNEYAVQFGVWSYLSWAVGLYMQKRKDELDTYASKSSIEKTVKPLLKRAKKEAYLASIVNMISNQLKNLPKLDFKQIADTIQKGVLEGLRPS